MKPQLSYFLVLLCALLMSPEPLKAQSLSVTEAADVYAPLTSYSIYRKGKKIGTHLLTISRDGENVSVDINSKITVRILKVPVFRFSYVSSEKWVDSKLFEVRSATTTRGNKVTTQLRNDATQSMLVNDKGEQINDELIGYATNHWYSAALTQSRLFNTIKGVTSTVDTVKKGNEILTIGGTELNTTRYSITGQIKADVWYGDDQHWVQLKFVGEDGSEITYVLDKPPAN